MSRLIVLDTETTGLSADNGDRVIELGCVELINRKLTGHNLHLYFNPERDSHPDALRVHGLTTEFLSDKPLFTEKARVILDYLYGAQLIIHNAPFDMGFLDKEFLRLGLPALTTQVQGVTDTLTMAKEMFPGKRNSLDALCDRLEVDNSGRTLHGALLDAELLADVYINMTRGQNALVMDEEATDRSVTAIMTQEMAAMDLRALTLPILKANAQELAAHAAMLQELDKSSAGKTIWRAFESA